MAYTKRQNGRKFNEPRPIVAKAGVIKNADGSGYFKIGNTVAYATVYGPRELYPRFQQNPKKGIIRVTYSMMPFSGQGERVRPGPNRRAKEISMVSEKALSSVVDLNRYPNAVVDVFIDLPQTDAGSRAAGISAASIALADAGIIMRDMVASIAVGRVDGTNLVDLDYSEEAHDEGEGAVDIPVAIIPSTDEIVLLQMDGIIKKDDLKEAIELAREAGAKIAEIQREALRTKYKLEGGKK